MLSDHLFERNTVHTAEQTYHFNVLLLVQNLDLVGPWLSGW